MNSQKYLACPISEITAESNYSYMQLTRLFRKTTGMTMQDYFLYVKLEYAAQQLRLYQASDHRYFKRYRHLQP
ncbi:MAG: AraC family transcriptional regulator [Christensenellaceae bacterium]